MTETLRVDEIIIRDYRAEDDVAINELEKKAAQYRKIPIISSLFKVSIEHIARFDSKASQFDSYHILCMEDTGTGTLCGVVACGCKQVWLHGQERLCGYIYDLRIHEDYQRRGLGQRLSEAMEARCRKSNVEFLYLTVNGDNEKAKELYKKLGFLHASHRHPTAELLTKEKAGEEGVDVKLLSAEVALPVFEKALLGRDMSLASFVPVFKSPLFEGALYTEEPGGESAAGLCLWDSSSFSTFKIDQFILPPQWYTYTVTKAILLSFAVGLEYLIGSALWNFYVQQRWITFGFGLTASIAAIAGAIWAVSMARFMGEWVLGRKKKIRCRLFAHFGRGPNGPELLKALVIRAQNIAFERGYLMVICNLDIQDPLHNCFGTGRFRTTFLQKPLSTDYQAREFSPYNFHDPRDI